MFTLGLSNMRDAAAALVHDGQIVAAAEEERFVRTKHVSALPVHAIRYCLKEAGLRLSDVHAVAVPWKYWEIGTRARLALGAMLRSPQLFREKGRRSIERLRQEWWELACLRRKLSGQIDGTPCPPVTFLDHHMCHAASAFLVSPFERAAVMVVDGASESHSTMMAFADRRQIQGLNRTRLPHSLGQFYAAMTAYLGFKLDHDEYIVMGLAAYGEPRYAETIRRHLLRPLPGGTFTLNTALLDFHLARVGIFVPELVALLGPSRLPDEEVTQRHRDLAASVQLVLEEVLLDMASVLRSKTKVDQLCLAGGVAYNCVANGRLWREAGFGELYIPPAAGDSGAAMGAALWHTFRRGAMTRRPVMTTAYWGPQFSEADCQAALRRAGLQSRRFADEELCDRVAQELSNGKLVFWFQGRMEWGPRALGNRSLLADPRREDIRALINAKVKQRELFRPFAPSVPAEEAGVYFDLPAPSPFMLVTVPVKPSAKGIIPAVVHVDGSARVQTVDRLGNPLFHRLLQAFARRTGVPVLLNTSFNVQEPIVCSPEEAIRCFQRTEVDWLVLGNLLVANQAGSRLL
ncbi:MAG: carbamoyltransferase [Nitrospirota bacterium]|nr:carbamoyltransferase [Nitrospirota bacterium]